MKNKLYKKATVLGTTALVLGSICSNAQIYVPFNGLSIASSTRVIENEPVLGAYPNPIIDKLQLTGMPENGTAHIVNMLGIQVLEIKSTARTEDIDVSNLRSGIYMLQVCDAQGNCEVKKLVKE